MATRPIALRDRQWRATGANVTMPQYALTVKVCNAQFQNIVYGEYTANFPNIIAQLSTDERKLLVDAIEEALIQILINRHREG